MTSTLGLGDSATADRGFTDFLDPVSPAAGANYSTTVGSGDWWRIVSCQATLTTDANVANRLFSLDLIRTGRAQVIRNAATVLVTASTTNQVFQWDHAHSVSEWNTGTPVFSPLVDLLIAPGMTIQLTVDNVQVGDQISAIHFVFEKFYPRAGSPAAPATE